jgi:hypothetical protein
LKKMKARMVMMIVMLMLMLMLMEVVTMMGMEHAWLLRKMHPCSHRLIRM